MKSGTYPTLQPPNWKSSRTKADRRIVWYET